MSLRIGATFKDGVVRLVGIPGLVLTILYAAVMTGYMAAFNTLLRSYYEQQGISGGEGLQPTLDASTEVLTAIVVGSLLVAIYISIVAIRTFVAGNRKSIPRSDLTSGILFSYVNLIVGGFVVMVLIYGGFVLPLVPALFLDGVAMGVGLLVGFVVGLVVMTYLLIGYVFMAIFVVDEHENFIAAMEDSWNLARGNRWQILGLFVFVMVVSGFAAGVTTVAASLGVDQSAANTVKNAINGPIAMFSVAIFASAYVRLREDSTGSGGRSDDGDDAPDEDGGDDGGDEDGGDDGGDEDGGDDGEDGGGDEDGGDDGEDGSADNGDGGDESEDGDADDGDGGDESEDGSADDKDGGDDGEDAEDGGEDGDDDSEGATD